VDFGGGWLDVPAFARPGAFIVNCAISPLVSREHWPYARNSGVGGSAAHSVLCGDNAVEAELKFTGWQDPAVILETGLCVWRSGPRPVLEMKVNPDWLAGLMALWYSGKSHSTADILKIPRNYDLIAEAGGVAARAVASKDYERLCSAVNLSHSAQVEEGMKELPSNEAVARKYVGSGYGGYGLYLFAHPKDRAQFCRNPDTLAIEPFIR
jgi:hypothetical protein